MRGPGHHGPCCSLCRRLEPSVDGWFGAWYRERTYTRLDILTSRRPDESAEAMGRDCLRAAAVGDVDDDVNACGWRPGDHRRWTADPR